MDANLIVNSIRKLQTPDEQFRSLPFIFKLVFNKNEDNGILKSKPLDYLMKDNLYDIPIMMGYTNAEGIIMIQNPKKIEEFNADLQKTIPVSLNVAMQTPQSIQIAKEIRNFYFDGEQFSKDHKINKLVDLLGDINFNTSIHMAVDLHKQHQKKSSLYFYNFAFDGDFGFYKQIFQLDHIPGVCHTDDLFYLFESQILPTNETDKENRSVLMRRNMCRMWTNFAKYGNPTPETDTSLPIKWTPVDHNSLDKNCLYIGDEIKMIKNPDEDRVNFWKRIYETYNDNYLNPKL